MQAPKHTASPTVSSKGDTNKSGNPAPKKKATSHTTSRRSIARRKARARRRRLLWIKRHRLLLAVLFLIVVAAVVIISVTASHSSKPADSQAAAVPEETYPASTVEETAQATSDPQPTQPIQPTMTEEYTIMEEALTTNPALGLPESPRVDDSYFNDSVFVGDSISDKLRLFVKQERKTNPNYLGNASFITAASFSARNALKDVSETSIHPTWQGEKMRLEDLIPKMGVKKVFIMLGMNDVGISGYKDAAQDYMTLIRLIREKSPDVQIFIETATPRLSGTHPTTKQLLLFNLQVNEYVQQLADPNIYIIDVGYIMRDESGNLIESYCSDPDNMAIHFTNDGCRAWVDYLYTHALTA